MPSPYCDFPLIILICRGGIDTICRLCSGIRIGFLFHSIRLIQNYTAIGIRGEKVAILVGDGKPTMPRLQQLQWLPGFSIRIRLFLRPPKKGPQGPFFIGGKRQKGSHVQECSRRSGFGSGCKIKRRTPGKPQSRSEARESGAKGVLDGGMLPPFPPNFA